MRKKKLLEKIKKLEKQLEENFVEGWISVENPYGGYCKEGHKITLAGKVDAILKHLGLEIEVTQKKCTEPKAVVKKVKAKK